MGLILHKFGVIRCRRVVEIIILLRTTVASGWFLQQALPVSQIQAWRNVYAYHTACTVLDVSR